MKTRYNPERRTWRGRSYHRGGRQITSLREKMLEPIAVLSFEQDGSVTDDVVGSPAKEHKVLVVPPPVRVVQPAPYFDPIDVEDVLRRALKAIEGNDMDYYACHACGEKYSHDDKCVAKDIYRLLKGNG